MMDKHAALDALQVWCEGEGKAFPSSREGAEPIWLAAWEAAWEARDEEVASLREVLALCDPDDEGLIGAGPDDAPVGALCARVGFGAVMDAAARIWRRQDPVGAKTVGPCVGTVQSALRRAYVPPPRCP